MPPKLFYFDLGNVLLSFSHLQMCQQMGQVAGLSAEAVRELVFGSDEAQSVYWQCERGELEIDGYYEYFCGRIGARPDRKRLEYAASDIFSPINQTVELVERLFATGNRLAILSNTNPLQWQFIVDGRYPWLASFGGPTDPFAWAITSFEALSMKPDRRIYELAIERAQLPASDIFFVDDRPENVAGAIAAGLDAVQFVGAEQLRLDLKRRGVSGI